MGEARLMVGRREKPVLMLHNISLCCLSCSQKPNLSTRVFFSSAFVNKAHSSQSIEWTVTGSHGRLAAAITAQLASTLLSLSIYVVVTRQWKCSDISNANQMNEKNNGRYGGIVFATAQRAVLLPQDIIKS